jgi:hypothetical protein
VRVKTGLERPVRDSVQGCDNAVVDINDNETRLGITVGGFLADDLTGRRPGGRQDAAAGSKEPDSQDQVVERSPGDARTREHPA